MTLSDEIVREIAESNPLMDSGDEVNRCRFCEVAWCSSDYDDALEPTKPLRDYGLGFVPHQQDCLWVRANDSVRELV